MNIDIARAWKDEEYRNSLSEAELAQLPLNPAGTLELDDATLEQIMGGWPETSLISSCGGSCTQCGSTMCANTCFIITCVRC